MNRTHKILWGEGLFLKPQHFQYQDLYHENRLAEMSRSLQAHAWGVRSIDIDEDALDAGLFRLKQLTAVMPDGECINAPASDALPDAFNLGTLAPEDTGVLIHIALPCLRENGPNFASHGAQTGKSCRYRVRDVDAPDLFTTAAGGDLTTLEKSLRLISDHDNRDHLVSMPIARIRRTDPDLPELDPAFMPPSLALRSSGWLHDMLRRLVEAFQSKAAALRRIQQERAVNVHDLRAEDAGLFWLLQVMHVSHASLRHFLHQAALHPERLFHEMMKMAAQLLTFSTTYALTDLPDYQHGDPGPGFAQLDRLIRDLMDTVVSSRHASVMFTETKPAYHTAPLPSDKHFARPAYYLCVSADMPAATLMETVPQRFKVGTGEDVERMVATAMPGIRLILAAQVPAALPVRPGCVYFLVEPQGMFYSRLLESGSMTVYAPACFPRLRLELIAIAS